MMKLYYSALKVGMGLMPPRSVHALVACLLDRGVLVLLPSEQEFDFGVLCTSLS
jgi:hypothetical protein